MRERIIVAAVAIPLLGLIIFLAPVWALGVLIGAVSAISAFELLECAAPGSPRRFTVYAAVSAFLIPIFGSIGYAFVGNLLVFALAITIFTEFILSFREEKRLDLETVLLVLFAGAIMPLMLGAIARVGAMGLGRGATFLPFVVAFSCDSGAYFAGRFFGKRKIFPQLSPNKTLEGCIGGVAATVVIMLLYGLVLALFKVETRFWPLAIYGIFGSLICQLGDLAFSGIKRQYNIKDFGTLIPGHGGALDRFDSLHFVAPAMELMLTLAVFSGRVL
ncbi:MAG: phosphatidate cytidylyltransferase [Oscillospiraceae bacterium]|nr:phosphatidate cytidylyltransferase [Oscillospiraceae bacterium]